MHLTFAIRPRKSNSSLTGNIIKVMLKTSSTGTLSSLRCLNENLVIRDGGNLLSSALSLVCGVTGNVAVTSTGSTVVIVFSSNNSLIRTGFKIDYSFDGNNVTADNNERTILHLIMKANKNVDKVFIQGDIDVKFWRSARTCNRCQWEKTNQGLVIVPYFISEEYSKYERSLIQSSLLEFSTMTCVVFKERTSESDYISIGDGDGCSSFIGRTGGKQTLSLARNGCMYYGLIQHEVMHTLGFFHEHTRRDRDNYVRIMWQYISPEYMGDFKKDTGDTMNLSYDYSSIMHYDSTAFSKTTGQKTIVPIPDANVPTGQENGLSALDVKRVNLLYNCNICRTKLLGPSGSFSSDDAASHNENDNCLWLLQVPSGQVDNGGSCGVFGGHCAGNPEFQLSSRILLQINQFVCPSDNCKAEIKVYDGITKNSSLLATFNPNQSIPLLVSSEQLMLVELIDSTSQSSRFNASYSTAQFGGTFTTDNGSAVSPRYPSNYPSNTRATYVIIAPLGKKVMLKFSSVDIESSPECLNDFLLIRDGGSLSDPILGLYCGPGSNTAITSTGSTVVMVFSSNASINKKGFKIDYSFVSES
ncbi:astacin-like metalloendopeptidase [Gastrophryne carolinensis]